MEQGLLPSKAPETVKIYLYHDCLPDEEDGEPDQFVWHYEFNGEGLVPVEEGATVEEALENLVSAIPEAQIIYASSGAQSRLVEA